MSGGGFHVTSGASGFPQSSGGPENTERTKVPQPKSKSPEPCEGCKNVHLWTPVLCVQEHKHYLCGWCAEAMRAVKGWDEHQPCPEVLTDNELIMFALRRSGAPKDE